jgi:hypothetical protein
VSCPCVPEGTPEFGALGGIFHLEPIRYAGLVATQIPDLTSSLQASLRDADPMDSQPGDKSPGYYRVSLRDEGKPDSLTHCLPAMQRFWCGSHSPIVLVLDF